MTHPIKKSAMDKACEHISDAFRKDHKDRVQILLNGHRAQTLVEAGRYSFAEACRLMNVSAASVADALDWLIDDNARLNATYDSQAHGQTPGDYTMVGWFAEQDEAMKGSTAMVINFMEAIGRAQVMQQNLNPAE
jgi:hypothetical protein